MGLREDGKSVTMRIYSTGLQDWQTKTDKIRHYVALCNSDTR